MFCIKCGTQLPEDALFCSKCGMKVGGEISRSVSVATNNNEVQNVQVQQINYSTCRIYQLEEMSKKGDMDAELELARRYVVGEGVSENKVQAHDILRSISERNNIPVRYNATQAFAQRMLADSYRYGEGCTQDYEKALQWYDTANRNGDMMSYPSYGYLCYEIASTYQQGSAEFNNYLKEAFTIFTNVSQAQNVEEDLKPVQAQVQDMLGRMYFNGEGCKMNIEEAEKWFNRAVNNGYTGSYLCLAEVASNKGLYKEARKYYNYAWKYGNDPYGAFWYGVYTKYGIFGFKSESDTKEAFDFALTSGFDDIRQEIDAVNRGKYAEEAKQINKGYSVTNNTPSTSTTQSYSSSSNSSSGVGSSIMKGIGSAALGFAVGMIASAFGASTEKASEISYNISRNAAESDSRCFITTAVCQSLHAPDDCKELIAIRRFRDGYLRSESDGESLIKEYYKIGPQIVSLIDGDENPREVYSMLWNKYIKVCYDNILQGKLAETKQVYIDMVLMLCHKYGVTVEMTLS